MKTEKRGNVCDRRDTTDELTNIGNNSLQNVTHQTYTVTNRKDRRNYTVNRKNTSNCF